MTNAEITAAMKAFMGVSVHREVDLKPDSQSALLLAGVNKKNPPAEGQEGKVGWEYLDSEGNEPRRLNFTHSKPSRKGQSRIAPMQRSRITLHPSRHRDQADLHLR